MAYGPICTSSATVDPSTTLTQTRVRGPMRESRISVRGPITASWATTVAPARMVPGSMRASCPISTSASIVVVAGSTIVTPLRMCPSAIRWRSSRSAAASPMRSLMPVVSSACGAATTATRRPPAMATATRSVR